MKKVVDKIVLALVQKRKEKKLTQSHVAAEMKTTASAIARLEGGGGPKQHSPSLRTLKRYAGVLDYDLDVVLTKKA